MDRQEELQSNEPAPRDKGFTLIELLIVIVILGIFSTIVVLSVRGITDKGGDSACAADFKTLEVAHEAYLTQNSPSALPYANDDSAEQALVAAGYLRGVSTKYNIVAINNINPTATSGCTFDTDGTITVLGTATIPPGPGTATWTGTAPASFAALSAAPAGTYVAAPTTAWTTGQVAVATNNDPAHWNGTAWVSGPTP